MELAITLMLILGLRILWTYYIRPIFSARKPYIIPTYKMYDRHYILVQENPGGKSLWMVAYDNKLKTLGQRLGFHQSGYKIDHWWFSEELVEKPIYEMKNPQEIITFFEPEIKDLAQKLLKQRQKKQQYQRLKSKNPTGKQSAYYHYK